jgi:DNA-binding protein WhiA
MAQSFSAAAKAEICKIYPQRQCCALAQCFGILLYCNSFSSDSVRIITECKEFVAILPKLFKKAFGLGFDQLPDVESGKMVFSITDPVKLEKIFEAYGFYRGQTISLHVNLPVLEEECCKAAFLRGAFLAGGSVTDPEKSYHMEFSTTHGSVARETFALMGDILPFSPKLAIRGGGHVLYLKHSDLISDLLTFLGAPIAAMGIMEAKLEKEIKNRVNRRCNCDDANISKVVEAAQEQLAAIRHLKEYGGFEKLPAKLQQAALAREENPEASLTELAALMEPPISKPAMNHRLKKIMEAAKEANV